MSLKTIVMDAALDWVIIFDQRFYFERLDMRHASRPLDRNISRANLELFQSIIEPSEVTYGLFWETLLSAKRYGGFGLRDLDTNIFVLEEERSELDKLLPRYAETGLKLVDYGKNVVSLMKQDEHINIYFLKRVRKPMGKRRRRISNIYYFDAVSFEYPARIGFEGMQLPLPLHSEKILTKIYGSQWYNPEKKLPVSPNYILNKIIHT